jgi:hypothetical protein
MKLPPYVYFLTCCYILRYTALGVTIVVADKVFLLSYQRAPSVSHTKQTLAETFRDSCTAQDSHYSNALYKATAAELLTHNTVKSLSEH